MGLPEEERLRIEADPLFARIRREELAERARLEAFIKSATDKINAAVSDPFAEAKKDVQAKAEKLQALEAKLGELPKEIEKLNAEAERLNAELEPAIESGTSLTKLTKDLSTIRAKKEEVEVMQEVLATKLIPKAETTLAGAKKALEDMVVEIVGTILEDKRLETMNTVQSINDELKGFRFAVNDTCERLGLVLHSRLNIIGFSIGRK
jgi:septal ring factor EnvC (AmiA/AmiB activator)